MNHISRPLCIFDNKFKPQQDGRTPLHLSAMHGDATTVQLLIAAGASFSANDKVTPAFLCFQFKDYSILLRRIGRCKAFRTTPLLMCIVTCFQFSTLHLGGYTVHMRGATSTAIRLLASPPMKLAARSSSTTPLHSNCSHQNQVHWWLLQRRTAQTFLFHSRMTTRRKRQ